MRASQVAFAGALVLATSCATLPKRPPCGALAFATSDKRCVPEAWSCSPLFYAGGPSDGCDCNCGVKDPDCNKRAKTFWCYGLGTPRQVSHCALCDAAPGQQLFEELWAEP